MATLGWHNPLPLEIGGDTSIVESTYLAMRSAVGIGGTGPVDGIEDAWRAAKARAIAAVGSFAERAALQAFPNLATDHLPVYETLLGLPVSPVTSATDREELAAEAWVLDIDSSVPGLRAEVMRIDSNADVEVMPIDLIAYTHLGRSFGPRFGGTFYNLKNASEVPNFSSAYRVLVSYTLVPPAVSPPSVALAKIKDTLNDWLPSWIDWGVYTGTGFFLDGGPDGTSLLDLKAFDE